jgi:hypothetical protein
MSNDGRLNRVYRGLSAAERVALLVAAFEADEPMPYQAIGTMPSAQDQDFGELATLAAGTYRVIFPYARCLRDEARSLCLQLQVLSVLTAWGLDLASAGALPRSRTRPGPIGPRLLSEVLRDSSPGTGNPWEGLMLALAASLPTEAGDVAARLHSVQRVHRDVLRRLNPAALPADLASVLDAATGDVDRVRQGLAVLSLDVPALRRSDTRVEAELRELIGLDGAR